MTIRFLFLPYMYLVGFLSSYQKLEIGDLLYFVTGHIQGLRILSHWMFELEFSMFELELKLRIE